MYTTLLTALDYLPTPLIEPLFIHKNVSPNQPPPLHRPPRLFFRLAPTISAFQPSNLLPRIPYPHSPRIRYTSPSDTQLIIYRHPLHRLPFPLFHRG